MKKLILLLLSCSLYVASSFAQFIIADTGIATSRNMKLTGTVGMNPYGTGVLTVESDNIDPGYNFGVVNTPPLGLISTLGARPLYSYMNIYQNKVNYYVTYDGQVYTKSGLVTTSDSLCKENISNLEPTMDKIRRLHGVSFDYKNETPAENRSALSRNETELDLPMGATPEISRQILEEKSRKRIGLLAQEVERVFPEVIRTSYDGTKGILYNDLVGVLVEGMKELQDSLTAETLRNREMRQELDEIKATLAALTNPRNLAPQTTGQSSDNKALGQANAELGQNTPNPFNRETEIGYRLSADASSASVCIYNLNGQQLKKYPLDMNTLSGKVTVSASEFAPGIYIYSLVINNRAVDSKRMTLTD